MALVSGYKPRNADTRRSWRKQGIESPPESEGSPALMTLQFQISDLQNSNRIKFCCVKSPSLW